MASSHTVRQTEEVLTGNSGQWKRLIEDTLGVGGGTLTLFFSIGGLSSFQLFKMYWHVIVHV